MQSQPYSILDHVHDAVIVVDLGYHIQYWNPAAEALYGWAAADVLGHPLTDFVRPRYLDGSTGEQTIAALGEQGWWRGDVLCDHRDGHELAIESSVRLFNNADGIVVGLVGINRDITARRRAEQERAELLARERAAWATVAQEVEQRTAQALENAHLYRAAQESAQRADETLARLDTILASAPIGLAFLDHDLRYVQINPMMAAINGQSVEYHLGKTVWDVIPVMAKQNAPLLQSVLATGTAFTNLEFTTPPSETRRSGVYQASFYPVHSVGGQVIGVGVMFVDITQRKQSEAALRLSEANLRALFNSLPHAYYLLDTNCRILAFNQIAQDAIMDVLGQQIAIGDSIMPYVPPDGITLFQNYYQQCLNGKSMQYERFVSHPSGIHGWFEMSYVPVRNPDNTVVGVVFSTLDVTERKRAEESLRVSQSQLANIIDSAMDAIITVDGSQRIVLFNAAAEQMFGYQANDVLGQLLDRLIPDRLHQVHRGHIEHFGHTGISAQAMNAEFLAGRRANGEEFPIEASISQVNADGQKLFTAILRDITERRRLESQLRQAQKMELVGQLAGGVAHDFNNLLTVISGYAELARETLPTDHPVQDDLKEVKGAVGHGASLTRQLLAFARKQILLPQVISINNLVQQIDKMLQRLIGENIGLHINLAADLAAVRADPDQIQQILVNLAVNARDAMPTGGRLMIATTNMILDTADMLAYGVAAPGPHVAVTVSDTGLGMTPEVQKRLFEPFFTTKEQGRGTGLGLATCYGIVKQHRGGIWVTSVLGKGTQITVYVPAVAEYPSPIQAPSEPLVLPGGSERILLVEDAGAVRSFAARVLRDLGYTVLEAADGMEALRLAEADQGVQLLLTDIVMPRMGGVALASLLLARLPHLRVIYISGYTDSSSLHNNEPLLHKPFTRAALAQKVRTALDR